MRRERGLPAGIRPFDVALAAGIGLPTVGAAVLLAPTIWRMSVPVPVAVHVVSGVLATGLLLVRRRHPTIMAAGIAAIGFVSPTYFIGAAAYSAGAYERRRVRAWLLLVAVVVVPWVGWATWLGVATFGHQAFPAALTVALGVLGFYVRERRRLLAAATDRAERAEREQELLAEQARAEERTRLAAEMHDVVTHRINLMVLQAGALGVEAADEPVRRAAEDLRVAGCQALAELRDLVGVLRSGHTAGATEPAAPSGGLATLVAASTGVDAHLIERGDPGAMSPTVRRTLHRVVQESLTNAERHAPRSRTTVEVSYEPHQVRTVIGNGPPAHGPGIDAAELRAAGAGVGLLGLRQRVELVGGTLTAAPTTDGGFAVTADLPARVPNTEGNRERALPARPRCAEGGSRDRGLPAGIRPFDVALALALGIPTIAVSVVFAPTLWRMLIWLPVAVHVVFGVLATGLFLVRGRHPLTVAAGVAVSSLFAPTYFVEAAAYAVGAYARHRVRAWLLLVALVVLPWVGWAHWRGVQTFSEQAFPAVITVALGVLGFYVGERRRLLAALTDRAERAEREQELLAERARAQERTRLAAEMHDAVTYRVDLMVQQADALRVDATDEPVRRAAGDLQGAGCQALVELGDLVGVMRPGRTAGAAEVTVPSEDLAALVAESASAGLDARLTERGDPDALSPTVRRTLYRVVQESLTNAGKHAPGSRTTVEVDYDADQVLASVRNGSAAPVPAGGAADLRAVGGGVGLLGLRQRVELVGGTLAAGPTADGGFAVTAELPGYVPTAEVPAR